LAFRHARHLLRDRHIKGSILKAPSATLPAERWIRKEGRGRS
jgi:hypothetical protein